MQTSSPAGSPYRLDQLGWLQFERLCSLVLEREAGLTGIRWVAHADEGRVAVTDGSDQAADPRLRLPGPLALAVVWVRSDLPTAHRLHHLLAGVAAVPAAFGFWTDQVLVMTNLAADQAQPTLAAGLPQVRRCTVLGAMELGESLDRHPELRVAMPSVLGLRDLAPLIDPELLARSSLDLDAARALAEVFWPTRAYDRACAILARHRFVVLTGPPEMGKTAIARALALAKLTDGWEVHECTHPEQVWHALDRQRRQLFIADDAFGSTEYRADAAERWARELGRMLAALDERHWLIWTSRPGPLRAGIRRIQRERGAERFPAPGEVLVDAADLDLAEKTLILFRHAKRRPVRGPVRRLLRSAAGSIVEHPHFTPERIRRLTGERLDRLLAGERDERQLLRLIEDELTRPTEAMRSSFRVLGEEYRELLTALLDAPAGLINERALATIMRRHHTGGLSRPPAELIDRLTDHFLRATTLGIDWVHPSWRDLVIDELRRDPHARRRFLGTCGIHGAILALSREGGEVGERRLPLLVEDGDWDVFADRLFNLLRELDDHDLARLLAALRDALSTELEPTQRGEADSLAQFVLTGTCRAWRQQRRTLPVFLLEAWYALNSSVSVSVDSPPIGRTWTDLHPPRDLLLEPLTAATLQQLDEWLALVALLIRHDPELAHFRLSEQDQELLGHLARRLSYRVGEDLRPLAASVLGRIAELAPDAAPLVERALLALKRTPAEERWWVPHDIPVPSTTDPARPEPDLFTRADVERVFSDL